MVVVVEVVEVMVIGADVGEFAPAILQYYLLSMEALLVSDYRNEMISRMRKYTPFNNNSNRMFNRMSGLISKCKQKEVEK